MKPPCGWTATVRVTLSLVIYCLCFVFPHLYVHLTSAAQPGESAPPYRLFVPIIQRSASHLSGLNQYVTWGSPIVVSPQDESIWVVNPDSDSVSVIDAQSLEKTTEIAVDKEPWSLAFSPDGNIIYIASRSSGTLVVIDTQTRTVQDHILLGSEPGSVVVSPNGSKAFVTLISADAVAVVDTEHRQVVDYISVASKPYAISLRYEGEEDDGRMYVTHLLALANADDTAAINNGQQGLVTVVNARTDTVVGEISLVSNDHGFPNLLTGITFAGSYAWLPHVRAAPELPNGLTTTVFAAVSALDLTDQHEDTSAFIPLNDATIFGSPVNNPTAAIPAPDAKTLYVVLAGSDLVEVVDVSDPQMPQLVKFLATGKNPRGMALSQDGRLGYVMNYLSRSVTVLDLESLEPLAEISTTEETLAQTIIQGKILFNTATNPRLTQGSWISCASCHFDGLPDGVTWFFPDGPRQTPMLWNAGKTLPWHWSATLDEPQDVEDTIQIIQHGLGLAPGTDPLTLGRSNAGRSTELDALAAFLDSGLRSLTLASSSDNVNDGRDLFVTQGCVNCHGGTQWTVSELPGAPGTNDPDGNGMVDVVLREVGTLNPADIRGDQGFDPPSLLGIGLTSPYLHDGSMPTLEGLLASGHPNPQQDHPQLSKTDQAALAAFLRTIGPATMPLDVP